MLRLRKLFGQTKCSVIGMIHVGALPGTPGYAGSVQSLVERACQDAEIYKDSNIDAVLLENMHDVPYVQPRDMGPEITAVMARICTQVREMLPSHVKCGVQVLAGGNKQALAIALAADLQFIRAEGFVFSHMADEGFTDACAGPLLRYRTNIRADNILVFTDIKKKHSAHAITADISLQETAKAAEFFLSDGVIVTGVATGDPVDEHHFQEVQQCTQLPVLIGSGVTTGNVDRYMDADAVIVGTHFKDNQRWQNSVNHSQVLRFMDKIHKLRNS
ncbi:uncharacterized protein F13E9.13, mitochondrial [Periplaneta americana]|uniref:uncharacterized protein F13E9.13, mitochondrial n=1 Tax=Periplaneta americana TaxID=6978 RepID=UPI0037E9C01F